MYFIYIQLCKVIMYSHAKGSFYTCTMFKLILLPLLHNQNIRRLKGNIHITTLCCSHYAAINAKTRRPTSRRRTRLFFLYFLFLLSSSGTDIDSKQQSQQEPVKHHCDPLERFFKLNYYRCSHTIGKSRFC